MTQFGQPACRKAGEGFPCPVRTETGEGELPAFSHFGHNRVEKCGRGSRFELRRAAGLTLRGPRGGRREGKVLGPC